MNLLPVPVSSFPLQREIDVGQVLDVFLGGLTPRTLRAYRQALNSFTAFSGKAGLEHAARSLLAGGPAAATVLILCFRAHLIDRGLSPSTVNVHLSAVKSLLRLARLLGVVTWSVEVPAVKSEAYRDTRGPGLAGVRRIVDAMAARQDAKGIRDRALLRLLYDLALRRAEVVALDVSDVDLETDRILILGKGRTQQIALTLPAPTRKALAAWLAIRGTEPGPLFLNFDRAHKGGRLTGTSLYRLIRQVGASVGLTVRPHGLRHAAITEALELTRGDLRRVQKFSRHRDVRTIGRYDDNREDLGGEVASQVADTA